MAGRLLWLPAALRNAGLHVVEIDGWEHRGKPTMRPKAVILHHTAGARRGNAPSLNVCVNGRQGLRGPLCQVLIGRDGTCFVIASGRCNHAGTGSWKGATGNSEAIGIEVENVGTPSEPWTPQMVDVMVRAARACARGVDVPPAMVCGHKEWAPGRKIDPHSLDMNDIRRRIAAPDVSEEDDIMEPLAFVFYAYTNILRRAPESKQVAEAGAKFVAAHGQDAYMRQLMASDEGRKLWPK